MCHQLIVLKHIQGNNNNHNIFIVHQHPNAHFSDIIKAMVWMLSGPQGAVSFAAVVTGLHVTGVMRGQVGSWVVSWHPASLITCLFTLFTRLCTDWRRKKVKVHRGGSAVQFDLKLIFIFLCVNHIFCFCFLFLFAKLNCIQSVFKQRYFRVWIFFCVTMIKNVILTKLD